MSAQRHIIKRQTIELKIQKAAEAQSLQAEMSRIYRQRIVPLIDKYCTELSQPNHIHRIELLEVDLGYLDPQHFEEQLVAKVGPAVRQALAAQIDRQEQSALQPGSSFKAMSHLELFAFFARTGSLPWWADTSQPRLLDECLQHLLQTAPEPLRRLLRSLIQEQRPLRRLIYHYSDELLAQLAGLLTPSLQPSLARELPELMIGFKKIDAIASKPAAHLRQSVWANILYVAGLTGGQPETPESFYQAVFIRVAPELGLSYDVLLADLYEVLAAGRPEAHTDLKTALQTLYQARWGEAAALAQHLARWQAAGGPLTGWWAALRALAPQLSTPLQADLLAALNNLAGNLSTFEIVLRMLEPLQPGLARQQFPDMLAELRKLAATGLSPEQVSKLNEALGAALHQPVASPIEPSTAAHTSSAEGLPELDQETLPAPAASSVVRLAAADAAAVNLSTEEWAELSRQLASATAREAPVDLSFSLADELYIGNAGLVILWPFLSHFFTRLELLAEKQFKDYATAHRAAGLLQYMATAEFTFPEYLLPLNKVLCGLELTELVDFGPPLTDREAEECTGLLQAVIAQAPILREMSVDGFRGTFLLRRGVLSERDGAGLLRVERETYDIVLDRFPWGWEWLKLPWMATPLRVEW